MSFTPFGSTDRPCWHCHYFQGFNGPAALCNKPQHSRVRATPKRGCSSFEREPGADDEPMIRNPNDGVAIQPD